MITLSPSPSPAIIHSPCDIHLQRERGTDRSLHHGSQSHMHQGHKSKYINEQTALCMMLVQNMEGNGLFPCTVENDLFPCAVKSLVEEYKMICNLNAYGIDYRHAGNGLFPCAVK